MVPNPARSTVRTLALALLTAFALAVPARAQPAVPAARPPAPPAAALPHLSPAETQTIVQLLNDPQKRAAFTAQIQALSKAAEVTTPKPAVTVPLAPDSVGAEVIQKSASWLADLGTQASAFSHVLGNLPAVWAFSLRVYNDPVRLNQALQAGWHLAVILLGASVIEWLFDRLLRRPITGLARLAPAASRPAQ